MWGEKTTLGTFGGGIDPSAVDLDDEDEARSREQFVLTSQTSEDLGVRLTRDLVEWIDSQLLKTGEGRHRLRLQPQRADWMDAMYIRAEPTDKNRHFDRVVMQRKGYPVIGIPRAWRRSEVVNGIDNPFCNIVAGDFATVRYLPEGAIEIYPEWVFDAHPRFARVRAAVPIVVPSPGDSEKVPWFNPAASTPYYGYIFEIVPFDGEVFSRYCQNLIGRDPSGSGELPPTADEFSHILTEGGVKPSSPTETHIKWETESKSLTKILSVTDRQRFRVVLPAKGAIHIKSMLISPSGSFVDGGPMLIHHGAERILINSSAGDHEFYFSKKNGVTYLNRKFLTRINSRWWGRYVEVPEYGLPIIYVPVCSEPDSFIETSFRIFK